MATELRYSLDTYPLAYALWGAVAASWLLAASGLAVRLARARPVARFDRPMARIVAALRDATAQRPVWRRPLAGAMHLAIMLGAVLVLATSYVTHLAAPRGPEWSRSHLSHALIDVALLLTLLGLAVAAWRRHTRRGDRSVAPTRHDAATGGGVTPQGDRSVAPTRHDAATGGGVTPQGDRPVAPTTRMAPAAPPARVEDVGLWALLLVGALTALLCEALLITLALPAWRRSAFLSAPLAGLLEGLSLTFRRSLYGWSWSVLHAVLLCMAFLLPWTKWRHIILAPFALLTRKAEPLARLDPVDLETDGPFGALRPRDLTWKERLDVAACVHCGRCSQACPAAIASGGTGLDPRRLIEALDAAPNAGPLAEEYDEAALWQCTTCMACDDVCPIGISPLSLVVDLRRERVLDAARFPQPLRDLMDGLARRGNPWGFPRTERDDWLTRSDGGRPAEELAGELPILPPGSETEVLLWLGCMGGYDVRAREATVALARVLRDAGVAYAVLGPDEMCCGDPARRAGNEALWRNLAERNIGALATRRFREIVTLCPHCASALANEYAALGAALPVTHAAPYLAGLLREGRLAPALVATMGDITPEGRPLRVALHDPCYLARGMGDTASARALLVAMPDIDLVELPHHGRDTLCCGAGGGHMWLEAPDEPRLGEARLNELVVAGVDLCVTACPYCRIMIADGATGSIGADRTNRTFPAVRDLVELLVHTRPETVAEHAPARIAARDQE